MTAAPATGGAALSRRLSALIAADPVLLPVLKALRATALPDAWLCSGAIVGCLWNHLSGRPARHGLKDIDLIYHDARDPSWAAEDRAIRRLSGLSAVAGVPVEVRNQARVHLWFPARFGLAYPPLPDACAALHLYPARCFALAARLGPQGVEIAAPFGLAEAFAMDVRPNPALPNRAAYDAKAARIAMLWPEAGVAPWPPCGGHESGSDAAVKAAAVGHGTRRL